MISKKIGTLSLNINTHDFNYGALLHSWAFQRYLLNNNLCESTEVIDYVSPKFENYNRKKPLKDAIKNKRIKSIIKNIIIYCAYQSRYKKFEKFINNDMKISNIHYTQKTLENANLDYDTVICESDVIWAPNFFGGEFDKTFFMNLNSMEHMKKIAYAPSMADGILSQKQEKEMKNLLKKVDFISCRETYEKKIIEKMTEKDVTKVLDPVMLLNNSDYEKISSKRLMKEKYLLVYLPVDNNSKLREEARKYAKEKGLKILEITTNCLKRPEHKTIVNAGIEEFLSSIRYADVIFTNSFHAVCFSLIFEREFYAFSRKTYGKVKDICDIVNLPERFFEDNNFKELPIIDYGRVNSTINQLKNESMKWINMALQN